MTEIIRHEFTAPALENLAPAHRISWREIGDASAPVLFCVHGLTRNACDFDILAQALATDYRVISVDMAGRGNSQWLDNPAHYHLGQYMADCVALLEHLAVARVHWLGTSMGGMIGMGMAAMQPQRIRSLMLNDVGAVVEASSIARIAQYVGAQPEFESRTQAEAALRLIFQPWGIHQPQHWQKLLDSSLQALANGRVALRYDPLIRENFKAIALTEKPLEFWEWWNAISAPTLLLRGETSDLLSRQTALKMAERQGVNLQEIAGCGHAPNLMESAQIALISTWLQSQNE